MQTKAGAAKARATNLAKDPDYYRKMGKLGGQASTGYGFAHGVLDPTETGAKGGRKRASNQAKQEEPKKKTWSFKFARSN